MRENVDTMKQAAEPVPRLSSADIVAVTTELRHRQTLRRRKKGEKKKDDTDDTKRELIMEEHKQSISELIADLGTHITDVCAHFRALCTTANAFLL